jgi:phosphoglucosamine mutase
VLLARDPRPSGPGLVLALASVLAAEGADVEDLGVLPTPALAWAVEQQDAALGVAVSASHNPPEYNGLKPFLATGRKLTAEEEREIEALVRAASADEPPSRPPRVVDGAARYVAAAATALAAEGRLDGLRIVVDLAAGAATPTAPAVLEALGVRVLALHPACSRPINQGCGTEHPAAWRAAVVSAGADAGIAFDGDADRFLLADEGGRVLDGDDALAILAADGKARGLLAHDLVVGTVMANLGLEERLQALGVTLLRTDVGDRHVAERMRQTGARLGGEPSGHVVLPQGRTLVGDGLFAAVCVLQAWRRSGRSLAELREATPRYPQILRNVRVREKRPIDQIPSLALAIRRAEERLGGAGRVLVRYSGTEPLLRIMAEGHAPDDVAAAVAGIVAEAERLA